MSSNTHVQEKLRDRQTTFMAGRDRLREGDEDYLCLFSDFVTVTAKTQFLLRSL